MFFLLWPLFARAPRHWFLENFLLSAPGVQSVLFFVALRWAPRPFGGARAKKTKTPPRVFFFAPAPGKGRGRRSPVGRRHGARAKKKHPGWCFFFFCSGPVPAPNGASPSPAFPWGRSKKTPWVVFFFFCSGPVPAPNGASPSLAFRRGRSKKKKKKTGWCFFFCSGPVQARGFSFPCLSPGPEQKKNTLGGFFCCGPARVFLDNNKKCLGYYIGSKKTRRGHSNKKTPLPGWDRIKNLNVYSLVALSTHAKCYPTMTSKP